jgi:hypothetical protein
MRDSQIPFSSQYSERAQKLAKLREQVSSTRVLDDGGQSPASSPHDKQ